MIPARLFRHIDRLHLRVEPLPTGYRASLYDEDVILATTSTYEDADDAAYFASLFLMTELERREDERVARVESERDAGERAEDAAVDALMATRGEP